MKRIVLIQHLVRHGCEFHHQGGNHAVYRNPAANRKSPVPRHNEIGDNLARRICKQLGIPTPKKR